MKIACVVPLAIQNKRIKYDGEKSINEKINVKWPVKRSMSMLFKSSYCYFS